MAGLYVARPDGYWWSGSTKGDAWASEDGSYVPSTFGYGAYGSYKPGASTSGIPAGSPALTTQSGTSGLYTVSAGGTYDLIDFGCEVRVTTSDVVTFTRCRFRGNSTRSTNGALLNLSSMPYGHQNVTVYDSEFAPDTPSIWWDAILNHDYTAHRCKVSGTVDGFGVYGSGSSAANVALYGCFVDQLSLFYPDPNHAGNANPGTHNDCVQWQGGANLTAVGNNFHGYLDPAIGEASYSSGSPNPSGGGPNNTSTGDGWNINYPNLQIPGAGFQVSGSNGGECAGMDVHDNWFAGCNRHLTLSQSYTALGTWHDNISDHDHLSSACLQVPTGIDGAQGSGASLELYDNTYSEDGSAVVVAHV